MLPTLPHCFICPSPLIELTATCWSSHLPRCQMLLLQAGCNHISHFTCRHRLLQLPAASQRLCSKDCAQETTAAAHCCATGTALRKSAQDTAAAARCAGEGGLQRPSSGDCAAIGNASDVQVLGPLVFNVGGRECRRAQRLLGLVHWPPPRHAQHERRLIRRGRARCDPEACTSDRFTSAHQTHHQRLPARLTSKNFRQYVDHAHSAACGLSGFLAQSRKCSRCNTRRWNTVHADQHAKPASVLELKI